MQWPVRSSQAIRNELILVFTGCNHDLNTFTIPNLQPSHCSPPHTAFSRCLQYLTARVTSEGFVYAFSLVSNMQHLGCFYFNWLRSWHWMIWVSERVRLAPQIIYRWTTSVASNKPSSTGFGLPEGHHHHWQYHWLPFAAGHGAGTVSPAQDFLIEGGIL